MQIKVKENTNQEFIRFDCDDNLYNDLETFYKFMSEVNNNEHIIKWGIICIHNCIQEFMIVAVKGTSLINIIEKDKKNNEKVNHMLTLYNKVTQNKYMIHYTDDKPIKNNVKRLKLIKELNTIRNEFSHPYYNIHSIDKSLLKEILHNAIDIIEELINNSGQVKLSIENIEIIIWDKLIKNIRDAINLI